MDNEKLAVIIPTKDRAYELERLLRTMSSQSVKPCQIIVVDGGDRQVKDLVAGFPGLVIDYVRRTPPSLTVQRNAGIDALKKDVTLVAFLDDDIVMEPESMEAMLRFWEGASEDVGGTSFNLVNEIYRKPSFFEKLFMVNANEPNKILRSGFQGRISCVSKLTSADWLVGCAMVYRRRIFDEFSFDEWFSGYSRYEDVDFSYRVGKKYKMYVVADAKVTHLNVLEDVNYSFALGRMEFVNRLYFVRKNPELSVPLCYWALFGIFINNIFKGIFGMDKRYLLRAKGALAGLFSCSLKS